MQVAKAVGLAVALSLATSTSFAHVTVWPRQSVQGAREKYVIRVPNEKRVPTTRVEGRFPPQVKVSALEQKPGWQVEARRDSSGAIVGAVWTGSLPPDQFIEFGLLAMNPAQGEALNWTFIQTYADGAVMSWSGAPGSPTPGPVVRLVPAAREDDAHH